MTLPFDYGPVDPNVVIPRYTSVDAVKFRLGIATAQTDKDVQIAEAIVAAEYAIDAELGRSVPDGPGVPDESEPGPVTIVPSSFSQAALETAIAVYKEADAPFGSAGSDAFFGAIDVSDIARRIIGRNPTLRGFKIGDGFGVA